MKNLEFEIDDVNQVFDQFWKDFKLFPSKWERVFFGNFFPFAGFAIFPYLVLIAVITVSTIFFNVDQAIVDNKMFDLRFIFAVVVIVLMGPPYQYWQSKIPEFFQWLLSAGKINDRDSDTKKEYIKYLTEYQKLLLESPRRYSLSIFVCFVVLIYILGDLNALNISIAP